jgi:hypothetical protein
MCDQFSGANAPVYKDVAPIGAKKQGMLKIIFPIIDIVRFKVNVHVSEKQNLALYWFKCNSAC